MPEEAAAAILHRWAGDAEYPEIGEAPNLAVCVRFPTSPLGSL